MIPVGTLIEVLPPRDKDGNKLGDYHNVTGLRGRITEEVQDGQLRIEVELERGSSKFPWSLPDYRVRVIRETKPVVNLQGRPLCPNCNNDKLSVTLSNEDVRCMGCGFRCALADDNTTARALREYYAKRPHPAVGASHG